MVMKSVKMEVETGFVFELSEEGRGKQDSP